MQNTKIKHNFFAGSEEVIARFVSLIITIAGFGIFFVSSNDTSYLWNELLIILGSFWFVYELVSLILFTLFRFFSNKDKTEELIHTEINEDSIK